MRTALFCVITQRVVVISCRLLGQRIQMNFIYLSMHLYPGDPLVFNLLSCRFAASTDIKFLWFVTLSASFPHFISGGRRRLLPGDQVIIRLNHLLPSMPKKCPYQMNMISIPSKIVCVTCIVSLFTSFLNFTSLDFLAVLLQNSISVL